MKISIGGLALLAVIGSTLLACGKKGEEENTSKKTPEFQFAKNNVGVWAEYDCIKKKEKGTCSGILITDTLIEKINLEKELVEKSEDTTAPVAESENSNSSKPVETSAEKSKTKSAEESEKRMVISILRSGHPELIRVGSSDYELVNTNSKDKAELWKKSAESYSRIFLNRTEDLVVMTSSYFSKVSPFTELSSTDQVYIQMSEDVEGHWAPEESEISETTTQSALATAHSETEISSQKWKDLQTKAQQADEEALARANRESARRKDPCQSNPLVRELVCRRR
jgi:hypothetical protein